MKSLDKFSNIMQGNSVKKKKINRCSSENFIIEYSRKAAVSPRQKILTAQKTTHQINNSNTNIPRAMLNNSLFRNSLLEIPEFIYSERKMDKMIPKIKSENLKNKPKDENNENTDLNNTNKMNVNNNSNQDSVLKNAPRLFKKNSNYKNKILNQNNSKAMFDNKYVVNSNSSKFLSGVNLSSYSKSRKIIKTKEDYLTNHTNNSKSNDINLHNNSFKINVHKNRNMLINNHKNLISNSKIDLDTSKEKGRNDSSQTKNTSINSKFQLMSKYETNYLSNYLTSNGNSVTKDNMNLTNLTNLNMKKEEIADNIILEFPTEEQNQKVESNNIIQNIEKNKSKKSNNSYEGKNGCIPNPNLKSNKIKCQKKKIIFNNNQNASSMSNINKSENKGISQISYINKLFSAGKKHKSYRGKKKQAEDKFNFGSLNSSNSKNNMTNKTPSSKRLEILTDADRNKILQEKFDEMNKNIATYNNFYNSNDTSNVNNCITTDYNLNKCLSFNNINQNNNLLSSIHEFNNFNTNNSNVNNNICFYYNIGGKNEPLICDPEDLHFAMVDMNLKKKNMVFNLAKKFNEYDEEELLNCL